MKKACTFAITFVVVAAATLSLLPPMAAAQEPTRRPSLTRVLELIDEHLGRARLQSDYRLRFEMESEAYAAILAIPSDDRVDHAIVQLKELVERLPEERLNEVERWKRLAFRLAIEQDDFNRAKALVTAGEQWRDAAPELAKALARRSPREAAELLDLVGSESLYRVANELCKRGHINVLRDLNQSRPALPWHAIILAEIGLVGDAERVARVAESLDGRHQDQRVQQLVAIAAIRARQGDVTFAQRVAEEVLSTRTETPLARLENPDRSYEACGWRLTSATERWESGSVLQYAMPGLPHEDWPRRRSLIVRLAGALAARGSDERSRDLIRRLAGIVDDELRRLEPGPLERLVLQAELSDPARAGNAHARLEALSPLYQARYGISLSLFAAGGGFTEGRFALDDASSIVRFATDFPRAAIAERVLAERDRLNLLKRDDPKKYAGLWFAMNILVGNGAAAKEALQIDRHAFSLPHVNLLGAIGALENTGARDEAIAAVGAYIDAYDGAVDYEGVLDLLAIHNHEESIQRAIGKINSRATSRRAQYAAAAMLWGMGRSADLPPLPIHDTRPELQQRIDDWIGQLDLLAWLGDTRRVEELTRSPPADFASLEAADVVGYRHNAEGFLAVALARSGDLEAAFKLVRDRSLDARCIYFFGNGYHENGRSVFSLPFLIQEWAARGHATR